LVALEEAMFVEQRLYTFAPGKSAEFHKLYEAEGRATQEKHLGPPVGYYYSEIGPLNQVMSLWAYPSLDERVARRDRLAKDPAWVSFLHKGRPLIVAQETRILKPASFFADRLAAIVEQGGARS
jgi:NIPSNAP